MIFRKLRPLVHTLDADRAHQLTIATLKRVPPLGAP